jgi:hypothetical protein
MTGNLSLTGSANYIDVQMGGTLKLDQQIGQGRQDLDGGIAFGGGHGAQQKAVLVELGGILKRIDTPQFGAVPDQVSVAGAIWNTGGAVLVTGGSMLNITGTDGEGNSYWQDTDSYALLEVDAGNLSAAGGYEIDTGTLQLTAYSTGNFDRLDGAFVNFGDDSPTTLAIVDAANQTPGTVTVNVTDYFDLAGNTTTTMNFVGGDSSSVDHLDVRNGTLNLNGLLDLNSYNKTKLNSNVDPGYFFDNVGASPSITDRGLVITSNAALVTTYSGQTIQLGQNLYYQVTMQ